MKSFYEITVGNAEKVITVAAAENREITISGKSYVVPSGVVTFIEELAGEVQRQQDRKTATDLQIAERIEGRVDQVLRALDQHGFFAKHLDEQYPLPPNVETDGGSWTVLDEARSVARDALKNKYNVDAVEDIGSQFGKTGR